MWFVLQCGRRYVVQGKVFALCQWAALTLLQAKENVRKAAETKNPAECQRYLAEALRAFSKGARNLEFEKLREVIGDFQQLSYAQGLFYTNPASQY